MKNVIESYLKKSKRNIESLLYFENKEIISSAKVLVKTIKQDKKIEPGSYKGRKSSEPETNRRTLMENKNA